jgi:hypothetical protein
MITGRVKLKYSEKNLLQCDYVHHKSDIDCSGIKSGSQL